MRCTWVLAVATVRAALLRAAAPQETEKPHAPAPSADAHGRGSEPIKGSALRSFGGKTATATASTEAADANATATESADAAVVGPPVRVQCGGKTVFFPADMILISGKALWCPNAKVATTTIYDMLLGLGPLGKPKPAKVNGKPQHMRCNLGQNLGVPVKCPPHLVQRGLLTVSQVPPARHHELCSAFSFTFVRNPWDRVRSAYIDKVVEEQYDSLPETWPAFVRFVAEHPTDDIHWTPFNERCATNTFEYSFIGQLEDNFDWAIRKAFLASGLVHAPHTLVSSNSSTVDQQAEVLGELRQLDARDSHRAPNPKPLEVPHKQNSGYSSGIQERRKAYLEAPGIKYPKELVDLVGKTYAMDIWPYGYSFAA